MKKFLPLLAVVAITAALISVAVTRGFGSFSATTSSGTCTGTERQIRECVKETCGNANKSPEYRECVQRARGITGKSASAASRRPRPAAPKNQIRRGGSELRGQVDLQTE